MSYYKRDKLSIKSNELLANILAELILLTEDVETYRQLLANTPFFDCIELFRVLDKDEKGYLCLKDFQYIIGSSHKKLVAYAFSYFDQGKLGQVSRLQFSSFLLSRRNMQLRQLVSQRIQTPELQLSPDYVVGDQLKLFTNLIQAIINQQMKIICLRKELLKSDDYSIKGVLSSLDVNDHKWVSLSDVHKFMQNYGISTPIDQVQNIVQLMDSEMSGKITIDQLQWIIQGFQGNSKEYLKRIKSANRRQESVRQSRKTNVNVNAKNDQSLKTLNINQSQRKIKEIDPPNIIIQNGENQKKFKSEKKERTKQNAQNYASSGDFYSILQKFKEVEAYSNEIDQKLKKQEMILKQEIQKQFDQKVRQRNIIQNQKYIEELRARKSLEDIKQKYNYEKPYKYDHLTYLNKLSEYSNEVPYIEKQKDYRYNISHKKNDNHRNDLIDHKIIQSGAKNQYKVVENNLNQDIKDPISSNSHLSLKQKQEIDRKVQSIKNSSVKSNKMQKKDSIYSFSNSRKDYGASSRYERLFPNEDYKYNNTYAPFSQKFGDPSLHQKKLTFFQEPYTRKYDSRVNSISDYNLQTKKSHFFDDKQQVRKSPQDIRQSKFQSSKKQNIPIYESPSRRVNDFMNTHEKWKYGNTTQTRPGETQLKRTIF